MRADRGRAERACGHGVQLFVGGGTPLPAAACAQPPRLPAAAVAARDAAWRLAYRGDCELQLIQGNVVHGGVDFKSLSKKALGICFFNSILTLAWDPNRQVVLEGVGPANAHPNLTAAIWVRSPLTRAVGELLWYRPGLFQCRFRAR